MKIISTESNKNPLLEPSCPQEEDIAKYLIYTLSLITYLYSTCAPTLFKKKILPLYAPLFQHIRAIKIYLRHDIPSEVVSGKI